MESNDSPEIPDRGETSDIPGLPSGALHQKFSEMKTSQNAASPTFKQGHHAFTPIIGIDAMRMTDVGRKGLERILERVLTLAVGSNTPLYTPTDD